MITEFGRCKLDKDGYYRVTGSKNHYKYLHRLIYEDYYGIKIPKNFVIHHKNKIKTDNSIENLEMIERSEHSRFHNEGRKLSDEIKQKISMNNKRPMLGKHHSEKTKQKLSNAHKGKILSKEHKQNISFSSKKEKLPFRVIKKKRSDYVQGFIYKYRYQYNGKRKEISSVDLNKLKEKVLEKGLEWIEYDDLKN